MTQQPLNHSFNVPGMADSRALERYSHFIAYEFEVGVVPDNGQYVLHHCDVTIATSQKISIRVHTTGNVNLAASPQIPVNDFNQTCTEIEALAHESAETINSAGNIPLSRCEELLGFISGLGSDDDNSRTVIVTMADTINEIVLRESLKNLGETGSILRDSVPAKISKIESHNKRVYMKDAIKSLRTLRNNVLHEGQLPSKAQSETSLETASNVLRHC